MGRRSPLQIEGTGLSYRDPDTDGRLTVAMVRAKDETGAWQCRRFNVTSWHRNGTPVLPLGAVEWARETRKSFVKGAEVAGVASVGEFLAAVADDAHSRGVNAERVRIIRRLGERLEESRIADMKGINFASRVRDWLNAATVNWAFDVGYKFRRTVASKLAPATKNKLLVIIKQAVHLAVIRRRLAFDPLAELRPFKQAKTFKPLFTIDELRDLVSDAARCSALNKHADLERTIVNHGGPRTAAIKSIAKDRKCHWTSIYNALARKPEPDQWWLPCCLLVFTGARAQEALHLRWEWIKWDAKIITLKHHADFDIKSDAERNIPLEPELAAILHPMAKAHGWIIEDASTREGGTAKPNEKTGEIPRDYQRDFSAYCGRIGLAIGGRTVHSLRHGFITMKIARGDMNLDRLRKGVGHADIKTTQGYSSQSQEFEVIVDRWPDSSLWLRRELPADLKAKGRTE